MRQELSLLALGIALSMLCGVSGPAMAEEGVLLRGETDAFVPPADTGALGGAVLDEAALAALRGGTELQLSEIHALGTVSDVTASDLVTGHNIVTEGSLSGASGIPMLIQNSGNGVLIQNAVIVNVDVQ
jgi:hypothetical protein